MSHDKLLEMKNSLTLGLSDKGLAIGAELMSRAEYSDVREEATFYIAELFFLLAIESDKTNSKISYASKAYTYYLVLQNDYPSSQFSKSILKRINFLLSSFKEYALFRDLLNPLLNESSIVEDKLRFATNLFDFKQPNPYIFFLTGISNQTPIETLDRYFDEIIVNHPEFEIFAYYYKILAHLSTIRGVDFFKDGIVEFDIEKISLKETDGFISIKKDYVPKGRELNRKLNGILSSISKKYPNHPLILNLHLIFAKIFINITDDKIDSATKKHVEFVVQNELDKTHPRYLLAKEFLISNKFY
ncbi:MAG: hypothetical protein Q8N03_10320 [Ignavibacteria bacterium]|nr:hypothetical protein [Ignavibacteria bacterium]MDP3831513.1 hypothetical protein [Ignavibacteriaceae bacterium]